MPPKDKLKPKSPSFLHCIIKSNKEDLKLKEYVGTDEKKRIVWFPDGRILTYEERMNLAASLIVTLKQKSRDLHAHLYVNPILEVSSSKRKPVFLSRDLRKLCNQKWERYQRWRKKNC